MNIKFYYEYRDAGNYKEFGEVVFSNSENLNLSIIEEEIKKSLIDQISFIAKEIRVPELFFIDENFDDHDWHNLISVELTDSEPSDVYDRTILEFTEELKSQGYNKQAIRNSLDFY
jgi:hypothetical protein